MEKQAQWHILAYDIKNPKRLQKVHRLVSKSCLPLQKSVYFVLANEQRMQKFMKKLEKYLNLKEDDVRTYPIESAQTVWLYGSSLNPDLVMDNAPKMSAWQRTKQWLQKKYKDKTTIPDALVKGVDHSGPPKPNEY